MLSPVTVLIVTVVLVFLLAQFGGRLAARSSLMWWMGLSLFMLSAIAPQLFRPIADLLGIKLVSNLVLASMVMFLTSQLIEQMSVSTTQMRGHRRLVSRLAVAEFLAKRSRQPVQDPRTRVLVVLPCYNEAESLPGLLEELAGLTTVSNADIDFCIVDDGSHDASKKILEQSAPVNHVTHLSNIGVAGVLMTGFEIGREMGMDYIVQCDSDGQHPVSFIPELVRVAHAEQTDLLVGSRFIKDKRAGSHHDLQATTRLRRLGSLMILMVLRLFGSHASISDPTSGFRIYSRRMYIDALGHMPDEYPEPELLALTSVHGGNVQEIGVTMAQRSAGTSSITGLQTMRYMLKVVTALLGLRLRTLARGKMLSP